MTKISIVEEREEDKFEHSTIVKCWKCDAVNGREIHDVTNNLKVYKAL